MKGLSEKEVKADKVIWPIPFTVVGNDLNTVYSQINRNISEIKDFLVSGGVSEDEITGFHAYHLGQICPGVREQRQRPTAIFTKSVVTVCTGNVDTVLTLMPRQSELLKKGIIGTGNSWDSQVQFQFEGLNGIKPEMIEDATRNAREAAGKVREGFRKQARQDKDSESGDIHHQRPRPAIHRI